MSSLLEHIAQVKDFIALRGRNGVLVSSVREEFSFNSSVLTYVVKYLRTDDQYVVTSSENTTESSALIRITACESEIYRAMGISSSQHVPHETAFLCMEHIAAAGVRGIIAVDLVAAAKIKHPPLERLLTCGLVVKSIVFHYKGGRGVPIRSAIYHLKRFAPQFDPAMHDLMPENAEDDIYVLLSSVEDHLRYYKRSCMLVSDMARCMGVSQGGLELIRRRTEACGGNARVRFFHSDRSVSPPIFGMDNDGVAGQLVAYVGLLDGLSVESAFDRYARAVALEEEGRGGGKEEFPPGCGAIRNLSVMEQVQLHICASGTRGMTSSSIRDLMCLPMKQAYRYVSTMMSDFHIPSIKVQEGKNAVFRIYSRRNYQCKLNEKDGHTSLQVLTAGASGDQAEARISSAPSLRPQDKLRGLLEDAERMASSSSSSETTRPPLLGNAGLGETTTLSTAREAFQTSRYWSDYIITTVKRDLKSGFRFSVVTGESVETTPPSSSAVRRTPRVVIRTETTGSGSSLPGVGNIDAVISEYAAKRPIFPSLQHLQRMRFLLAMLSERGNVLEIDDFISLLQEQEKTAKTVITRENAHNLIIRAVCSGLIRKIVFDLNSGNLDILAPENESSASSTKDCGVDSSAPESEVSWVHQLRVVVRNENYEDPTSRCTFTPEQLALWYSYNYKEERVRLNVRIPGEKSTSVAKRERIAEAQEASAAKKRKIREANVSKSIKIAERRADARASAVVAALRGVEKIGHGRSRFKRSVTGGNAPTEYFYPISFVDHTIDTCGIAREGDEAVINPTSTPVKQLVEFMVGLVAPNLFTASKELFKYLVCWRSYFEAKTKRQGLNEGSSRTDGHSTFNRVVSLTASSADTPSSDGAVNYLCPMSVNDILHIPGSFRFIIKTAGLFEEQAGSWGVKIKPSRKRGRDFVLTEDDLFLIEAIVGTECGSADLPSFRDVLDGLQSRNRLDTMQKLLYHATSWLLVQLSFLQSIGMCIMNTKEKLLLPLDPLLGEAVAVRHTISLMGVLANKFVCTYSSQRRSGRNDDGESPTTCVVSLRCSLDSTPYDNCEQSQAALYGLLADTKLFGDISSEFTVESVCSRNVISILDVNSFDGGSLLLHVGSLSAEEFHVLLSDCQRRIAVAVDSYWSTHVIEGLAPLFGVEYSAEQDQSGANSDSQFGFNVWSECLRLNRSKTKGSETADMETDETYALVEEEARQVGDDGGEDGGELVLATMIRDCFYNDRVVHSYSSHKVKDRRTRRFQNSVSSQKNVRDKTAPVTKKPKSGELPFYFWDSGSDEDQGESTQIEGDEPVTAPIASIDSWWSPLHDSLLLKEFLRMVLIRRHPCIPRHLIRAALENRQEEIQGETGLPAGDTSDLLSLLCSYGCSVPPMSCCSKAAAHVMLSQSLPSYLMAHGTTVMSVATSISKGAVRRTISGTGGKQGPFRNEDITTLLHKKVRNRLILLVRDCSSLSHLLCLLVAKEKEGLSLGNHPGNGHCILGSPKSNVGVVLERVMKLSVQKPDCFQRNVSFSSPPAVSRELVSKLLQIYVSVSELLFIQKHGSAKNSVDQMDHEAEIDVTDYYSTTDLELLEAEVHKRIAAIPTLSVGNVTATATEIAVAQIQLFNKRIISSDGAFSSKYGHHYTLSDSFWELVRSPVSIELEWLVYRQVLASGENHVNPGPLGGLDARSMAAKSCCSLVHGVVGGGAALSSSRTGVLSSVIQLTGSLVSQESVVHVSNSILNNGMGIGPALSDEPGNIQLNSTGINVARLFTTNLYPEDSHESGPVKGSSLKLCTLNQVHSGLFGNSLNKLRSDLEFTPISGASGVSTEVLETGSWSSSNESGSDLSERWFCPWVDSVTKQFLVSLYYALVSRVLSVLLAQPGCSSLKILESLPALLDEQQVEALLRCMVEEGFVSMDSDNGTINKSMGGGCVAPGFGSNIFEQGRALQSLLDSKDAGAQTTLGGRPVSSDAVSNTATGSQQGRYYIKLRLT